MLFRSMDHMMPEMDGIEAAQIIRGECGENGSRAVIIALTANAMEGVRETFLQSGFQDFITKPLDRRSLHEALLRWIPAEKRTAGKVWLNILGDDEDRRRDFESIVIEGIDTDEVVGHSTGSVADYFELLDLYCLDGERKLTVLRTLWEQRDYENYRIEVHGLKSASANVGAMSVSANASEQERAVNRGDTGFVDKHVQQLLDEYEAQIAYISEFLEKNRKEKCVDENRGQELERTLLVQEIQDALESLENFHAKDCAHKIEEVLRYRLSPDVETKLVQIQGLLKLYEDEAAENELRDLLKILKTNI